MASSGEILCMDCLVGMKELDADSVDCLVTDPPYGYGFMGKAWDASVPSVEIWRECLRVLKPGAFAFVMSSPRQDVLSRMIVNLTDAGFNTGFTSLYWCYASGFPKAGNVSKKVDKQAGAEREIIGEYKGPDGKGRGGCPRQMMKIGEYQKGERIEANLTAPVTLSAKMLDGSYTGFSPKPAIEVILVAMKPLAEKTYTAQAMANGKGVTWLDEGRIPAGKSIPINVYNGGGHNFYSEKQRNPEYVKKTSESGRFPANLLVSDDALNDGDCAKSNGAIRHNNQELNSGKGIYGKYHSQNTVGHSDEGSFSRYFDLDAWFADRLKKLPEAIRKTFPCLIVPKAQRGEKNKGCRELENEAFRSEKSRKGNNHPTCKPLKLMMYLVIIGSREGDVILDPFGGSGTTALAAATLNRRYIAYEREPEYHRIAEARLQDLQNATLFGEGDQQ